MAKEAKQIGDLPAILPRDPGNSGNAANSDEPIEHGSPLSHSAPEISPVKKIKVTNPVADLDRSRRLVHEGERRGRPRRKAETIMRYCTVLSTTVLPDDRLLDIGRVLWGWQPVGVDPGSAQPDRGRAVERSDAALQKFLAKLNMIYKIGYGIYFGIL